MAKRKATRIGKRKAYYPARIEEDRLRTRLGKQQIELAWEPGWSKLKEYSRHLSRRNVEAWTNFALRYPFEVVQQAARRGVPCIPARGRRQLGRQPGEGLQGRRTP